MALTEFKTDLNIIQKLDDEPNDVGGMTAAELKAKFDEAGLTIQTWINEVFIPALIASNLKFQSTTDVPEETIQKAIEYVRQKSKEAGETLEQSISDSSASLQGQITENYHTLHEEIVQAVIGAIPETSVTYKKLASDVTTILDNLKSGLKSAQGSIADLEKKEIVIDPATQTTKGLMSADDKKKLDGIAAGATNVKVDNALSETSTNAIMNRAVRDAIYSLEASVQLALSGKSNTGHTHTLSDITNPIDSTPTEGSENLVKSGGVYAAIAEATEETQAALDGLKQTLGTVPMLHIGGLMAAQAHQGGHAAYSENVMAGAFRDTAQFASYEGLLYRNNRLELLTAGAESGTITFPTTSSGSASGAFHPSGAIRSTTVFHAWVDICRFYPDAYGTLTNLTLQTQTSAGNTESTATKLKLSIWDEESGEMLAETDVGTIIRESSKDQPVSFALSLLLDPNRRYVLKAWVSQITANSLILSTLAFSVTPMVYQTGTVTMTPMAIPAGTSRLALLLHDVGSAASAAIRFDSGEYTVLTQDEQREDAIPGGTACTLRRYTMDIPQSAQTVQLKLILQSATSKLYDFALILS